MGEERHYEHQIEPRPLGLGGGWRLRLRDDDEEVGGGVFPLAAHLDETKREPAAYAEASDEADTCVANRSSHR